MGSYLNEHFVSAFQKVGTFRIVGTQKQGGNVASYFCAQDGRVLHVVAGPVNAATLLREARWVVDTARQGLAESQRGKSIKGHFRRAHAERLRKDHGLTVEAAPFDTPPAGQGTALTYRDPRGNPLAPVLPPPPIEGPDVSFEEQKKAAFLAQQEAARATASGHQLVQDRRGRQWVLNNQGRVHMLLAAHALKKISAIYGSIFEGILGEKVSTKPVIVASPFPWVRPAALRDAQRDVNRVRPPALQGIAR